MKCSILIGEVHNPYQNLATEQTLMRLVQPGEVIFYLWQNAGTVVIGRNQNPWRECNLAAMQRDSVFLARRATGGGAVFHDLGNLNFSFVALEPHYDVAKQTEVILTAVQQLGLSATRSGRNDLVLEGRKFSGHAYYKKGGVCLHHGTLLVDTSFASMQAYLSPSPEKLAGKGVASVRSRVVNLAEMLPGLTPETVMQKLQNAFAEVYAAVPEALPFARMKEHGAFWQITADRYAAPEWYMGEKTPYTARYAARLSFGEVEILLHAEEGRILQAQVYTDALDADWPGPLARSLQNCPFESGEIARRIIADGTGFAQAEELADFVQKEMTL